MGTAPPGFTPPSGAPRARQSRGLFGGGAFGKVVSKNADGFVVQATRPGETAPTSTSVTTTAATTYTTERKASADALKLGACVSARGQAESSGTIAARAITIRPSIAGSCDAPGGPGGGRG
ncbi:MAG: hypothetical protein ABR549_12285 [Mycobacteriales bacterium]